MSGLRSFLKKKSGLGSVVSIGLQIVAHGASGPGLAQRLARGSRGAGQSAPLGLMVEPGCVSSPASVVSWTGRRASLGGWLVGTASRYRGQGKSRGGALKGPRAEPLAP